jgi:hypothetical protein
VRRYGSVPDQAEMIHFCERFDNMVTPGSYIGITAEILA